jgi:hypothetical protein
VKRRKCRSSHLARLPIAPLQYNGERREHHNDSDDDKNAIERHLTSPCFTEKLLAGSFRKYFEMDQNKIADHAVAS